MKRSNFKTVKYIHKKRLSGLLLLVSFLMLISANGMAQPVANFSADITAVCSGLSVTFTDNTTGITGTTPTYAWDFGATASPSTASGPGPYTVTYTGSGTVTVSLTVTDDAGSDTETKNNYITISALPTTANAGTDLTGSDLCGLTSTKLTGNSPASGTGSWSIVSGSGGTVNAPANPESPFSGTAGTTYVLRWTISNPPCTASTDDVTVTFNQNPTTANAGTDQTGSTLCSLTSTTLAGNTPTAGTGSWSTVSGSGGSITTPSNPTSAFSGTTGTTYVLRWTISNSPCSASSDDVTITFSQGPTTANAGADQTGAIMCGLTSITLAGNTPSAGTGSWSIISGTGGSVITPTDPASTFTGTAGTTYVLRWTISNSPCPASTDDVTVTFGQNPTVANAGADQTGETMCGLTSTNLAGNAPSSGTGSWSIITGSGGSVSSPSSPTSAFNGTAGVTYILRWTISSSPCAASTDDVTVIFTQGPTTANAGADQTGAAMCGLASTTLAGNTPTAGTGSWSIVSGSGGSITAPTDPTSTFSGTAGSTYVLRWTISNSPCAASTDDVTVAFSLNPTAANAGTDQTGETMCGLISTTLAGNTPATGAGSWSIVSGSGGSIAAPTSPASTFTGTSGTTYILRWTISNSPCTASTDDVTITFSQNPTTAYAGEDQTGSVMCGLTSTTLAGNTPSAGTGSWSIISGSGGTITSPGSPSSSFSGTTGTTYVLRWTISSSPCTSSTDDVTVTFVQGPTTANAGADQTGSAMCGLTITTLAGNTPSTGTGAWSIVSGSGGSITTPSDPVSTFSGSAGTTYVLRWTISNTPCNASTDDVTVTFNQNPTAANAGTDQTGSAMCGLTSTTMAGNTPSAGTGSWSIISGSGGTITTPSSPTSAFNGTSGTTYVLRWTITSSPCTATSDDVTVTFTQSPSAANASTDQTGAAMCGLTSATLAGNTPAAGTGSWSIVSGSGGSVTTPSSPVSTFTGTAGTTYVLRWTISNSPCTDSSDDVAVAFSLSPTTANAGTDQTGSDLCGLNSTTLAGNTPTAGTGSWSIVSGSGGSVTSPTSATSTFSGTAGTTYVLRWTISSSPCSASTDDVTITFSQDPTVANAGTDQTGSTLCGLTSTTLAGNTPTSGTGSWSIVSGSGGSITTPTGATSTFSGTAGTTYILRWTISNSPCSASSDDVTITFSQGPTTANAGADQTGVTMCGLTSTALAGNTPAVGTGSWSIVSGSGGSITTTSSPTSAFSGTAGTTYVLRWTISNSPCTASIDDVTITFSRNPTGSNAGADQTGTAMCGLTSTTLEGNTPSAGTGTWSIISGSGGSIETPTDPTSTFSGTAGATYVLSWTISSSPCAASTDDVTITFNQNPTVANAGADQTGSAVCGLTSTTLAGNTPAAGTGSWSIISGSGGSVTTPSSPTSTFSGLSGTTYILRWTIISSPCTTSTDDVTVTFSQNTTVATAGSDQTGSEMCGLTSTTLAGNTPTIGTGLWSIVSGSGGSITTTSSPTSSFSGTAGTTYVLRWTISNSPCTASTDDVTITFNRNPTVSNAGSDQTGSSMCGLTSTTLTGNTPSVGTGSWSIVTGSGGSITTASGPTSTFSGTAGTTYVLRWTISNSPCAASSDDVTITFNRNPTTSNAGPDQTGSVLCGRTTTTLAGNTPAVGTGAWSIVSGSGGSITTPTSPTSAFSGTAGATYVLRWTVSNSPCSASTDDVTISFTQNPTVIITTPAAVCSPVTIDLTLPAVTTGSTAGLTFTYWTDLAATVSYATPAAAVTGTYYIKGTTTAGCFDIKPVTVTVNPTPIATATNNGPVCTGTPLTLTGGPAGMTTYAWTGPGNFISSLQNPTVSASATTAMAGTYTLIVTNSFGCQSTVTTPVTVTVSPVAIPGTGGNECDLNFTFNAVPSVGIGTWTSTGPGTATFLPNANTPNATVTVSAYGSYTFSWTEQNGTCSSNASVAVNFYQQPVANPGPAGNECDLNYTFLAVPSVGTGIWTKTTGPGTATFTPGANAANATVAVSAYGNYTFTWTESNNICTNSATITVNFYQQPVANAGTGGNNCGVEFNFTAIASAGTGTWTRVSGPGNVTFSPNPNVPNAQVTVTVFGAYVFSWTEVNGTCSSSSNVQITFIQQPAANGGNGGNECDKDYLLNAVPIAGTGTWTKVSGPGDATFNPNPTTPNATVSVTQFGAYDFGWREVNSLCSSTDIIRVTFNDLPPVDAGEDAPACKGIGLQLHATGTGSFIWSPANLVNNPNIADPIATLTVNSVLTVTLTDQYGCKNSDQISIEVREIPFANAGLDQVLEFLFDTDLEATLSYYFETGAWTLLSGTANFDDKNDPTTHVNGLSIGDNKLIWSVNNGACTTTDTVNIMVKDLVLPTLITPNLDGNNDFFIINGVETLGKTELLIFNRWGAQVYNKANYDNLWDGLDDKGNPLPEDTYFYILKPERGAPRKGFVIIRR